MSDNANTGNPAPLGLLAFGMTTVMLNFHNAGFYPLDSMILSMGLIFGGIAQMIAGTQEWKKGNTFAATAFTSYGAFWITLVAFLLMPKTSLGVPGPGKDFAFPAFLLMWGLVSLVLFIGTFKLSRALQFVFGTLVILFILLAVGDATGNETITHIAGWEGLVCGFSAIYTGLAQVINEVYGRTVCPLGPMAK